MLALAQKCCILLALAQNGVVAILIESTAMTRALLPCREASAQPAHVPVAVAEAIIDLSRYVADSAVIMLKKVVDACVYVSDSTFSELSGSLELLYACSCATALTVVLIEGTIMTGALLPCRAASAEAAPALPEGDAPLPTSGDTIVLSRFVAD